MDKPVMRTVGTGKFKGAKLVFFRNDPDLTEVKIQGPLHRHHLTESIARPMPAVKKNRRFIQKNRTRAPCISPLPVLS
jgi:hypothetical protein